MEHASGDGPARRHRALGYRHLTSDKCRLLGATPGEPDVCFLYDWLSADDNGAEVVVTETLPEINSKAGGFAGLASSLLAIPISKKYASYILWFRPEEVRTVNWGGNPVKPATNDPEGGLDRLHPRKPCEIWQKMVKARAFPWSLPEVEAAKDLRASVLGIVLRRAEELAAMSEELQHSHKELEAFSYSVIGRFCARFIALCREMGLLGATHFLTETLPRVSTEMALQVLAYNLTRVLNILGSRTLLAAIAT